MLSSDFTCTRTSALRWPRWIAATFGCCNVSRQSSIPCCTVKTSVMIGALTLLVTWPSSPKAVGEPPCATYLFEIKTLGIIDISLAFRSHAGLTEASKSCYNDSPFAASLIHPAWSAPKICSTVGEGYRGGGARLRHLKFFFCVGYLCLSSAPFAIGWAWSRTNCSLQSW